MSEFRVGDGKYHIVWKLVEAAGGLPSSGDTLRGLLAKYLTAIGGTPVPGDGFHELLRKVVTAKGGTPTPGDKEWDLLVKWLQTLGECRACGDSPHDLWRKILSLSQFVTPFNIVLVKASPVIVTFSWQAVRDPVDHWEVQFIACDQSGVPLIDVDRLPEDRDSFLVQFPNFPAGTWLVRIRDAASPTNAWVISNCVTYP